MQNKIMIVILGIVLISLASAEVITIEPETLAPIQIYSGENFVEDLTIKTDGNYLVFLDYEITNNTYNMEGFSMNLPKWIFVEEEKIFQIEISIVPLFKPDSFVIHFYASTEGIEAEETSSNEYDETTEIIDTEMGIELEIESNGTGIVDVRTFTENPASGFGIPSLNIFFQIEVSDSISEGMNETILKVFYTDEEVNALGLDENNLRLYFYNETTGNWQIINSWVDTTNNIVYGVTDHFSLWGIFGEKDTPTIIYRGGGGTKIIQNNVTEYVNNTIEVEVPKEIEVIKEIENTDKINELKKIIENKIKEIWVISTFLLIFLLSSFVLLKYLIKIKKQKNENEIRKNNKIN